MGNVRNRRSSCWLRPTRLLLQAVQRVMPFEWLRHRSFAAVYAVVGFRIKN